MLCFWAEYKGGEVCERPLCGAWIESEEHIKRRLETARTEMDAMGEFDQRVVNEDVDRAVAEITAALLGN